MKTEPEAQSLQRDAGRIANALARPLLDAQEKLKAAEKECLKSLARMALHRGCDREFLIEALCPTHSVAEVDEAIEAVKQESIIETVANLY